MSYRLQPNSSVEKGIKEVLDDQLKVAVDRLTSSNKAARKKNFHDVRRKLKKARAALRLVRKEIGEKAFTRENLLYRNTARLLSPVRDADVLNETLHKLLEHYADYVPPREFTGIRQAVKKASQQITTKALNSTAIAPAVKKVELGKKGVQDLSFSHQGWKALAPGLKTTYAQGRQRMRRAYEEQQDLRFHEWRKSVKYLRHQVELLEPAWPAGLKNLSDQLHELGDLLGEDHDLVALKATVKTAASGEDPKTLKSLYNLITARQKELRAFAWPLGARLYGEKPQVFVDRLKKYWRAPLELTEEEERR